MPIENAKVPQSLTQIFGNAETSAQGGDNFRKKRRLNLLTHRRIRKCRGGIFCVECDNQTLRGSV